MNDKSQPDLFDFMRARATDPDTSHEAVESINITRQCYLILRAYRSGRSLTDHEAYNLAGFPSTLARQRCSDLREVGFIEWTGERGTSPSGKAAYLCRITPAGLHFLTHGGRIKAA